MKNKKAQVWSADFVVSMFIFLSALILILFSWSLVTQNSEEQALLNNIESNAIEVTDILVRSPGLPIDWTPDNVQSIGLVSEENNLNKTKVDYFISLDYSKIIVLLGMEGYGFHFELRDLDNNIVKNEAEQEIIKGYSPIDARIIVPVERYALYGEEIVKLKFIFWSG